MYSVYTEEQYDMCTVGLMIIHRVMIDGNPNVVLALYHNHVLNSCGFLWCLSNNTMSIRYHSVSSLFVLLPGISLFLL